MTTFAQYTQGDPYMGFNPTYEIPYGNYQDSTNFNDRTDFTDLFSNDQNSMNRNPTGQNPEFDQESMAKLMAMLQQSQQAQQKQRGPQTQFSIPQSRTNNFNNSLGRPKQNQNRTNLVPNPTFSSLSPPVTVTKKDRNRALLRARQNPVWVNGPHPLSEAGLGSDAFNKLISAQDSIRVLWDQTRLFTVSFILFCFFFFNVLSDR